MNLFNIGMVFDTSRPSCPFYGFSIKTAFHLLVTCEIVLLVWYRDFRWLGWQVVIHHDLKLSFESFISLRGMVNYRGGNVMV